MMNRRIAKVLANFAVLAGLGLTSAAFADRYVNDELAAIDTYFAASEEKEVSLALSAAPAHISETATVLVMEKNGYRTAREGSNGFVCLVERSWAGSVDYIGAFWDPLIRAPICYNRHAAEFVLPLYLLRTELALAGKNRAQIAAAIEAAVSSGKLKAPTGTAMSYMMSAGQYLHPDIGRWLPHLMIWIPYTEQNDWGANVLAGVDPVVFRNPGGPFAMVVIPYNETRFIEP